MTPTVTPVRTRRDRRDFCALPRAIYQQDPQWIAPPASSVRRAMEPRTNPFHREAIIEHFVARDREGRCVGRIAAIIHPAHMRRHGSKAFFGLFEAIEDAGVARALLCAVEAFADARGIRVLQGPCSYTLTQDAGLLLQGSAEGPVVLQPHNPPYYAGLLEDAGYELAFQMSTFRISRSAQGESVARAAKRGDAARRRLGLTARPIDLRRFERELEIIRVCYNAAFAAHPETVAISPEVFSAQAGDLRAIVDPRLVRIVEKDGRAVAFSVAVPNVYEILASSRGRLSLKLLLQWSKLMKSIRSQVVIMIGGDPAFSGDAQSAAGLGLGSCLSAEVAMSLEQGWYDTVHTTWIHERNWQANMLMRAIGAKPLKHYGIFQRSVA